MSGLDKTAIDSLPFFRFSALKGSKQGLECSVCLSKFEDVEILRLLPKCKHAFHIECIDHWLDQHATCPLCRNRVSIEDELSVFSVLGCSSNSLRIMGQLSDTREEESSMEIHIEREEGGGGASDGSSLFSSFRKILKLGKNDKSLSLVEQGIEKRLHKFRHRIVVSDAVLKNRWSNMTRSDLTRLTLDMLSSMSGEGFASMERMQRGDLLDKEGNVIKRIVKKNESTRRAASDITAVPRLSVLEVTTATRANAVGGNDSGLVASTSRSDTVAETEERRRQLWLPIARQTGLVFSNREK
ncbi:putative RING-H2 finger protein ATL12 [Raphanus sativus]|nr:putative RING-H2 finger protein ATL12 [Raphanus sativus]